MKGKVIFSLYSKSLSYIKWCLPAIHFLQKVAINTVFKVVAISRIGKQGQVTECHYLWRGAEKIRSLKNSAGVEKSYWSA